MQGAGSRGRGSAKKETSHATVRFFVARFIYYDYLFCFSCHGCCCCCCCNQLAKRTVPPQHTCVCNCLRVCVCVCACVFGLSRLISFVQVCLSLRHFFSFFCSFCLLLARFFCCCFVTWVFFLFKSSTNRARVCHAYCAHF